MVHHNLDTVSHALNLAIERGDIRSWSLTYTGGARSRPLFTITGNGPASTNTLERATLGEARAYLHGVMSTREQPQLKIFLGRTVSFAAQRM